MVVSCPLTLYTNYYVMECVYTCNCEGVSILGLDTCFFVSVYLGLRHILKRFVSCLGRFFGGERGYFKKQLLYASKCILAKYFESSVQAGATGHVLKKAFCTIVGVNTASLIHEHSQLNSQPIEVAVLLPFAACKRSADSPWHGGRRHWLTCVLTRDRGAQS